MSSEPPATINLDEVYPAKLNDGAKEAVTHANQKLTELRKAKQVELQELAAACLSCKTEIHAQQLTVKNLGDAIESKRKGQIATDLDQSLLQDHEHKLQALIRRQAELAEERAGAEGKWIRRLAKAQGKLEAAHGEEQSLSKLASMAAKAVAAYKSDPRHGIGPIPRYHRKEDALRALFKVGFLLDASGAPFDAITSFKQPIKLSGGARVCVIPRDLSWLHSFPKYFGVPDASQNYGLVDSSLVTAKYLVANLGTQRDSGRIQASLPYVYIEESGEVLTTSTKAVATFPSGKSGFQQPFEEVDFSKLIPRLDDALRADLQLRLVDGAYCLGSSNKESPLLGQLIDGAWEKARDIIPKLPLFAGGQRRMSMAEINGLIGRYWDAFLASPWEPSIEGTYALLKHRCARGEIPNVYSFEVQGHFGFRVRTPDHDWIIGEIYCPPDHFTPDVAPDPTKLANLTSGGDKWLAELGPVKFCIRKTPSRT